MSGQILAVWGNPGAGKTTMSIKLACELAERSKNSIVILSDITAPDMNVLLPFEKNEKSMGGLFTNTELKEKEIINHCVITSNPYISFLGYRHGENIFSNPQPTKGGILEVLQSTKNIVDFVIIDCIADFPNNILSTVALEVADTVFRLCESDLKAFSFFDSNLPMLADNRFHIENHLKVLSKGKWFQAKDAAVTKYGGIDYFLDYQEEIEQQLLDGNIMRLAKKEYHDEIVKMADHILGESSRSIIKSEKERNKNERTRSFSFDFKLKKKDKGDFND